MDFFFFYYLISVYVYKNRITRKEDYYCYNKDNENLQDTNVSSTTFNAGTYAVHAKSDKMSEDKS